MRTPLYLRAQDKETMIAALDAAGLVGDEGNALLVPQRHDMVIIGTIMEPTGAMISDPEVGDYPEMAPVPGYHVNVLTDDQSLIDALGPLRLYPNTPAHKWFGYDG